MASDPPRRTRSRRSAVKIDNTKIVDRVLKFFEDDNTDRSEEKTARLQRYAKYRMWTERKTWPWEDSANVPLTDIMEKGLRVDDTLHNAVMSARPVINASAVEKSNQDKQESVDRLLDYQFFVEQQGENIIGDLANAFSTDGEVIAFVPWVKEMRQSSDSRMFPPIPDEAQPFEYFTTLIAQSFSTDRAAQQIKGDGWDWVVATNDGPVEVSFYVASEGADVEMTTRQEVTVYDGPLVIQKEWDDVLYPSRSANLHIPGPSNPHGAGHVILVDYPTVDEVRRLAKSGIYDRLTKEDLKALDIVAPYEDNQELKDQKDIFQGTDSRAVSKEAGPTRPQNTLTRLMCFDVYDARGTGTTEDMVWTVIRETKSLARAKPMTELFPASIPRRPIEHEAFIPVRGRVAGIGMPEMLEGLHDTIKALMDQIVDSGTMKITPPWFYRPFGGMKPETIRLQPGEGYPLGDPTRDVHFPTANTQTEVMGLNLIGLLDQKQERVSTIGDLQLGRVPQGKSSALRTVGGMSLIAGQGEARPERLLRRFFSFLSRVYAQMHERNRFHLPAEKQIQILGLSQGREDPYLTIDKKAVEASYIFDFKANVLNTSKEALQQGLQQVMSTGISAIAIQLGLVKPEGVYRMLRDNAKAWGADPDQYFSEPSPGASRERIFAEEAIRTIIGGGIPDGVPAEAGGAAEHLQKLLAFMDPNQDLIQGKEADFDEFGLLDTPEKVTVFQEYMKQVSQLAAQEQQQAALAQAAGEFGGVDPAGGQGGRPPEGPPEDPNAPVQQGVGEIADESLAGNQGANANLGLAQ